VHVLNVPKANIITNSTQVIAWNVQKTGIHQEVVFMRPTVSVAKVSLGCTPCAPYVKAGNTKQQ